jgi:prophage antirepressor-like protein
MSELAVFKFRNAFPVRVSDREGEPWFVAADVCKALAISNARDAISRLDDDEHTTVAFSDGRPGHGAQKINIVSESGLYALVIRSNKPEAREFRKWITAEVLPTIRRTGRYEAAAGQPPVVREKPLILTIAEMVRSLNARITAGEDVPAHVLKYAWNMAGITRDLTLRKQRNALFAAPHEFTLRESAADAEMEIVAALEERTKVLPGLPAINAAVDRVFIRSAALSEMLKSMPEEWRGKEIELTRLAAGFLPQVSPTIRRFPHHSNGALRRASGILWNGDGDRPVRVVDLRDGELREIEKG